MAEHSPSLGSRLLARVLERKKISQADVARALKISGAVVSRWLSGTRTASLHYALELERLYAIPPSAWGKAAKKSRAVTAATGEG